MMQAILGSGCFWCSQGLFQEIKGVQSVISGYSGGNKKYPTYKQVCNGKVNHTQVCKIIFNPQILPYDNLIKIFLQIHDPTDEIKQKRTQYKSVIFYKNQQQFNIAKNVIKQFEDKKIYQKKILTELQKFSQFFYAEQEHQNFYKLMKNQVYCNNIVKPKIQKLKTILNKKD